MNNIRVIHALERRVRVLVPTLKGDTERMFILEILLRKHEAVREVRAVAALGSLAIHFNPRKMPRPNLLNASGHRGRQRRESTEIGHTRAARPGRRPRVARSASPSRA